MFKIFKRQQMNRRRVKIEDPEIIVRHAKISIFLDFLPSEINQSITIKPDSPTMCRQIFLFEKYLFNHKIETINDLIKCINNGRLEKFARNVKAEYLTGAFNTYPVEKMCLDILQLARFSYTGGKVMYNDYNVLLNTDDCKVILYHYKEIYDSATDRKDIIATFVFRNSRVTISQFEDFIKANHFSIIEERGAEYLPYTEIRKGEIFGSYQYIYHRPGLDEVANVNV